MKVLYDHQIFEDQKIGGISKYFVNLIKELLLYHEFSYQIPIKYSSNAYISMLPDNNLLGKSDFYESFMFGKEFHGKWRLFETFKNYNKKINANKNFSIEILKSGKYDLFHPTNLDPYFLENIGSKPFVITIHDMIDEIYPEYRFDVFSKYRTSIKKQIIEGASAIIAVSNQTKLDILKFFDVEEPKIHVIHHGSRSFIDSAILRPEELIIPERYLLYIGKRVHYKNFYFLIIALKVLFSKDESLKLVCCGTPFSNKEKAFIQDLGISNRIISYQVSEYQLAFLYRNAIMLIYPSLYEGFGLPILEAFRNRCPIAISDISIFREVADDAALYFNPKDAISIRETVSKLINNRILANDLIIKGQKRVKKFSLARMAAETLSVYNKVLN